MRIGSDVPAEVLKCFLTAIRRGDTKALAELLSREALDGMPSPDSDLVDMLVEGGFPRSPALIFMAMCASELNDTVLGLVQIKGDAAHVRIRQAARSEVEKAGSVTLTREGGTWKIGEVNIEITVPEGNTTYRMFSLPERHPDGGYAVSCIIESSAMLRRQPSLPIGRP
jgi:hypothetical protein